MFSRIVRHVILDFSGSLKSPLIIPTAGIKYVAPPIRFDDIQVPENRKLRILEKVPQYPPNMKPPKMMKRLKLMRGPELVNNTLMHRQYGIQALIGGRLRHGHFEMLRLTINRKLDLSRMFAMWRVDAPWQPLTRKGQGQRMGGGKGAIDHYVTPIKAGRIIVELGGHLEYAEAKKILNTMAKLLPFKAQFVSQADLDKQEALRIKTETQNLNPYTMKYVIQNNMGGCHTWLSPYDFRWFGEHQ